MLTATAGSFIPYLIVIIGVIIQAIIFFALPPDTPPEKKK